MKKKTVKLVSAVVALGVVSGAYVGVNSYVSSQEKKESEEEDTSVELTSLSTDDITSVAFTAGQDNVEFDKKDDVWSEKSDADFPVDQDTVNTAVGGIASLSAAQEISDVEDLSEYDLDSPQNEIKLTTDDGDTVLQIGMENESTSQYYVKKSDDDKNVYLVDSSAVEPFMGTLYDFAESGTFPSVTSSTITEVKVDKEDGYELTQDPDNLFWNVSDGKISEKVDTDKAGTVTSAIGSLAYDSFVDYNCTDDSKYGFDDPYAVITAKYTEEEAVEDDSEDAEDTSESTDETDTDSETSSEDESSTDSDTEDADSSDTEDDSEEEETKTVTVDKEITIYVGDETGSDRYVKVDDSKEVYTITEDSLTDILDSTVSDFYSLSVNYLSVNSLDSLEVKTPNGDHTVTVTRETTKDSDDEEAEETTTVSYKLDGADLDETIFTTFYNKLINMTAQQRLTEDYTPEGDPAYTFVFKDTDGNETTAEYYEYDTNFYAAVVGDKVYLVNKMNIRDMDEAEKCHRPVICFVDTPGAFCGIEAEERGQGEAIACNLWELAGLKTPVLSIVTGEGGSGGALALAAGDQVWMLENSVYSILSPEGFASILWKDSTKAKEAAAVMKLTASDLYQKGIIEQVIPEPENLTPESLWQVTERLDDRIRAFLKQYTVLSEEELLEMRYARFRKF